MSDAPSPTPQPPRLEGYAVLHLLGAGGTGTVWAVRRDDGVRFAAKVVDGGVEDLDQEAELLRALEHEHVVRLVEVVTVERDGIERAVLITELAEGGSMAQALAERERLTPGELVTVLCPVARALHDLHGLGLIHADLSPGNILLTAEGKPLIADLGTSHLAGVEGEDSWATEAWAAPEVLAGRTPTPAADTYSLGAIAWAALTGAPPGPAALRSDLSELAPELPLKLRGLVTSCLEHDGDRRPSTGDLALALWECAEPEPAPVAGSPGRRGMQDDPAVELTRRIRAEASRDDPTAQGQDPPWWRLAMVRRVAAVGAVLGLLCGLAAGWGPTALAWASGGSDRADAAPTRHPTTPTASASRPTTDAPASPGGGRPTRSTAPAHPEEVVQHLVDARAQAWSRVDPEALQQAMVAGSAAYRSDRRSLRAADQDGIAYRGLGFTVRSATIRRAAHHGTVMVRARIDRSAYTVRTAHGTRHVPAETGHRVDLELRRTGAGWRITDWQPVRPAVAEPGAG